MTKKRRNSAKQLRDFEMTYCDLCKKYVRPCRNPIFCIRRDRPVDENDKKRWAKNKGYIPCEKYVTVDIKTKDRVRSGRAENFAWNNHFENGDFIITHWRVFKEM